MCAEFGSDWFRNVNLYEVKTNKQTNKQTFIFIYKLTNKHTTNTTTVYITTVSLYSLHRYMFRHGPVTTTQFTTNATTVSLYSL